jgi:hypothetical protein
MKRMTQKSAQLQRLAMGGAVLLGIGAAVVGAAAPATAQAAPAQQTTNIKFQNVGEAGGCAQHLDGSNQQCLNGQPGDVLPFTSDQPNILVTTRDGSAAGAATREIPAGGDKCVNFTGAAFEDC